jgi:hypothetical protein
MRAPHRSFPLTAVTCLALAGCGDGAAGVEAAEPAPAAPATASGEGDAAPWLDVRGTSIVGFGILRLVPGPAGPATFRIRYREVPDGYATTGDLQLFVLPGDAFAAKDRAYAGEFLAFARTADRTPTDATGALSLETTVTASRERTVLVAYGPWTAPDAGRPAGDVPTFSLDVTSDDGAFEWVESEAGELITTNWSNRPGVARGEPVADPLRPSAQLHLEVRPMILYDGRLVRAADEPVACDLAAARALREEADALERAGDGDLATDRRERAADLEACDARADRRLVLTPALAEKFRRVPIRWR